MCQRVHNYVENPGFCNFYGQIVQNILLNFCENDE